MILEADICFYLVKLLSHQIPIYTGFCPFSNAKFAYARGYVGIDPVKLQASSVFELLGLFTLEGIQDRVRTTNKTPEVTEQNPV